MHTNAYGPTPTNIPVCRCFCSKFLFSFLLYSSKYQNLWYKVNRLMWMISSHSLMAGDFFTEFDIVGHSEFQNRKSYCIFILVFQNSLFSSYTFYLPISIRVVECSSSFCCFCRRCPPELSSALLPWHDILLTGLSWMSLASANPIEGWLTD